MPAKVSQALVKLFPFKDTFFPSNSIVSHLKRRIVEDEMRIYHLEKTISGAPFITSLCVPSSMRCTNA